MVDALLLFGHVLGVVVLVVGIGLEIYAVSAARRAATVAELRLAARPARILPAMMPLATLLMTRGSKRNYGTMTMMSVLILFGHWLDFYQMVMPAASPDQGPHGC